MAGPKHILVFLYMPQLYLMYATQEKLVLCFYVWKFKAEFCFCCRCLGLFGLVNTSTPFLIFFSVLGNVWKHRTTLEHSEFTMVIRADNLGKSNEKFEC